MERPPNTDETKKGLKNTNNGKTPSLDNTPPKLLQEDIDLTANILSNLKKIANSKISPKNGEKAFYSNCQKKEMFLAVQIGEELHSFL
jgi:hypothetical protein